MVHDLSAQVPAAGAEGVQLEHLRHGHLGDQPRRHDHRFAQERKPSPASHKRTWRNTHRRYGTVAGTMAQDNPAHGTRPWTTVHPRSSRKPARVADDVAQNEGHLGCKRKSLAPHPLMHLQRLRRVDMLRQSAAPLRQTRPKAPGMHSVTIHSLAPPTSRPTSLRNTLSRRRCVTVHQISLHCSGS